MSLKLIHFKGITITLRIIAHYATISITVRMCFHSLLWYDAPTMYIVMFFHNLLLHCWANPVSHQII